MPESVAVKTILVITDSLGVPRTAPEVLSDEACWVYRLLDANAGRFRFRLSTVPGLDSSRLLEMARFYHAAMRPDVIVLQVGIVDCYPRALRRGELALVTRLPRLLSRLVHALLRRFHSTLVQVRNIRYVPPERFRHNLQELRALFPAAAFVVVPVAPATQDYRRRNPLVEQSIADYNAILAAEFGGGFLAGCYAGEVPEAIVASDNHHLSEHGNRLVQAAVQQALEAMA